MEITGQAGEDFLNYLRKAIAKDQIGIAVKVPEEKHIIADLKRLSEVLLNYQAVYNLLLDSGLRLVESVKLISDFQGAEQISGFYRCPIRMFRKSKQA